MKSILFISINLLNINSIFIKHPISIGSIIIIQTINIRLIIRLILKNSWFSIILFISIIGGIIIIFTYISRIASNEKFKFSNKLLLSNLSMFILFLILNYFKINETEINNFNHNNFIQINKNEIIKSIIKFYRIKKSNLTILLILILYLTLVIVSIINYNFKGPLKIK